ncbi:MAG TPA: methyl-accepting chemotaxis protein [Lacunisphaera sp.]|nr:methyl-accepting chemotaxis protein [Lacunisphaera sp.]
MALSAVRLAAIGPQLATLAVRMEEQADSQARQAERIAAATRELTERLTGVISRLQAASGNVHEVMGEIARIADQTRILSINASIEAARAGEHGRAFSVVAREVQTLADQTRGSTELIEERVRAIQGSVGEVAATVAKPVEHAGAAGTGTAVTVHAVNAQVQVMAGTAESQRAGARSLRALGDQAGRLTEELLLAVGTFRLGVHRRAEQEVRAILAELPAVVADPKRLGQVLQGCLREHPGFELLYVTDAQGRQVSGNVGWKDGRTWSDGAVVGKSWHDRPWFRDAVRQPGRVVTTDIYRSAATGDYCFTISAVVGDGRGAPLGVLAADVNFQKLIVADTRR